MNKLVAVNNNAGNIYIGDSPEHQVDCAINELLKDLAATSLRFERPNRKLPVNAVLKIKHNYIQKNRHVISQYLEYSAAVEAAYLRIDAVVPFGRDSILKNISSLYYECLDTLGIDYFSSISIADIRQNADYIIDYIVTRLRNLAFESKNVPRMKEHVVQGINVVVAHAFVECIILEVPEYDTLPGM